MELPYSRRIVALVGGRGGGAGEEIFVAYELQGWCRRQSMGAGDGRTGAWAATSALLGQFASTPGSAKRLPD
jgi:hypothetical protein